MAKDDSVLRRITEGDHGMRDPATLARELAAEVLRLHALRDAARAWVAADDAVTAAGSLGKIDALEWRVVAGLKLREALAACEGADVPSAPGPGAPTPNAHPDGCHEPRDTRIGRVDWCNGDGHYSCRSCQFYEAP